MRYRQRVPLTPEDFYANARAAGDAEGRMPVPEMARWDVFPFEAATLRTVPLLAPVPERRRPGEDSAECAVCADREVGIWRDENWRLAHLPGAGVPLLLALYPLAHHDLGDLPDQRAMEMGVLAVHVTRAVEALPHVARAHVTRFGDGGAHLHVIFWARPAGQAQLRGSCLPMWENVLPSYPEGVAARDAAIIAKALVASYGGCEI